MVLTAILAIFASTNPTAPHSRRRRNTNDTAAKHAEKKPIQTACLRISAGLMAAATKASVMPLKARKGM